MQNPFLGAPHIRTLLRVSLPPSLKRFKTWLWISTQRMTQNEICACFSLNSHSVVPTSVVDLKTSSFETTAASSHRGTWWSKSHYWWGSSTWRMGSSAARWRGSWWTFTRRRFFCSVVSSRGRNLAEVRRMFNSHVRISFMGPYNRTTSAMSLIVLHISSSTN